jgi:hypothetical protein
LPSAIGKCVNGQAVLIVKEESNCSVELAARGLQLRNRWFCHMRVLLFGALASAVPKILLSRLEVLKLLTAPVG